MIQNSQHGFRKRRSCLTNLFEFLDKVSGYVDSSGNVDIAFLDFAKAFDKVSHRKLLLKLQAHEIESKLLDWITQWLKNSVQRVCIKGIESDWLLVLSGVPQGSVLGPILFLIFINDLNFGIKSWILKFADDTKIFNRIKSTADATTLHEDLYTLISWAEEWQMMFNVDKCKVMHIGTSDLCRQHYMHGH